MKNKFESVHAAVGFRGLDVHKEIHLFTSYLFQVTLEGIHSVPER